MAPKCTPDIGNDPAYNNHNSLPGVLSSLKSFKCMFATGHYQANDLPSTGMSKKEQRMTVLKKGEPEVMTYEVHRDFTERSYDLWISPRINKNRQNFRAVARSGAR